MAKAVAKHRAKSVRGERAADVGAFSRRTITIPPDIESAIDRLVGAGKFSAFAQEAFAEKLQRERIAHWLDAREASRGGKPLDREATAFAEAAWRKRR